MKRSGAVALSIVLNLGYIHLNTTCKSINPIYTAHAINNAPDQTFVLFDVYESGMDTKKIRASLSSVAAFLKQNSNFTGFILSYAGQRPCPGEAVKRAKIVRQVLIEDEALKSKQLKIVDAGYRSHWVIEVWFGPMSAKGQPPSRNALERSIVKISKECSETISLR